MSSKSVNIISLKFAPGLKKEFTALGESIRQKGVDVKYLLAESYKDLDYPCEGAEYITDSHGTRSIISETLKFMDGKRFREIFSKNPPSLIFFYNPHPLNPFVARIVKRKYPEAITCIYLHDPYKPDKGPYGKVGAIYFRLVELIQRITLRYMDHVISPSEYSSKLFLKHYSEFRGKSHIAPLIVPDQKKTEIKNRKLFSIVGTAHRATGHDTFVELVNFVAEKGLDYDFVLISPSNISKFMKKLSNKARKVLTIINKKMIMDSEINDILSKSYAVFRLDREVTQSGVIPVAYANETPVIVRDIPGLIQHVKHKENGYIIPYHCQPEDIENAMRFTIENFPQMSVNARNSYEKTWAEPNWGKYYDWIGKYLS